MRRSHQAGASALLTAGALLTIACGGSPRASTSQHQADASTPAPTTTAELRQLKAGGYRLLSLPVVDFERAGEGADRGFALSVTARFNKALPKGAGRANFSILSSGLDDAPEIYGQASRHCFVGTLPNDDPPDELRHPQRGQVVPLTINIVGVSDDLNLNVRLRPAGKRAEEARRRMGCGPHAVAH
jgi:hypothetical protein